MFHYNDFIRGGYTTKEKDKPNEQIKNLDLLKDKRFGVGAEIRRGGFTDKPFKTRIIRDAQQLELENIEEKGIKVQFGDDLLNKLIGVQVDDPRDKAWLDEYERRRALGETEQELKDKPPFGRTQKKVLERRGLGESNLKTDDKLEQIEKALREGNIQSSQERGYIAGEIAKIAMAGKKLADYTISELQQLKNTINYLKVPNSPDDMKLNRFYDYEGYKENSGLINVFMLGNIPIGQDLNKPILSTQFVGPKSLGTRKVPSALWQILPSLKEKPNIDEGRVRYLDIVKRQIKPLALYNWDEQQEIKMGTVNKKI